MVISNVPSMLISVAFLRTSRREGLENPSPGGGVNHPVEDEELLSGTGLRELLRGVVEVLPGFRKLVVTKA